MVESDIYTYLTDNLDSSIEISWGKIDESIRWEDGTTSVNFFKLPSQTARLTPSYLDSFQISVRNKYIDACQQTVNDIIELFHLFGGKLTNYRIWVDEVFPNGIIYEEEDIVHCPITLVIKYTGI